MSSVYLYAELLSNIRQVTLYASLQTDRNKETKIELSSDRKTISLSHDGEIATAFLPSEIAGTARLTIPIDAAKELSFRLQVAEATAEAPDSAFNDYDAPWPASDLTPAAQMRCRACQTKILKSTIDRAWKNLPSENWAEMMDFWHCHKPDDIETKDQQTKEGLARTKGYGSSSRVEAQPGVGLVDGSSFLLADQDCPGAQVRSLSKLQLPSSSTMPRVLLYILPSQSQPGCIQWAKRRRPFPVLTFGFHDLVADTIVLY